jgi:hypothetical protein
VYEDVGWIKLAQNKANRWADMHVIWTLEFIRGDGYFYQLQRLLATISVCILLQVRAQY